MDAVEWARKVEIAGSRRNTFNQHGPDGTKDGYDIPLTAAISRAVVSRGCFPGEETWHLYEGIEQGGADAV